MDITGYPRLATKKELFVKNARKVYNSLGFHKGYNFPLFVITCGAMLGFALARFQYLNIDGIFMKNTIPGDQYYYLHGSKRVGIILHLACVIPACFLVVFQFVPAIRYKAMIFHRINGYLNIILLLGGNAGAFMIINTAVGGSNLPTQALIGVLGVSTTFALFMAYTSIKTLQIDQHRAWMMRAWVWAASIISLRLIMMAANHIVTHYYTYWAPIPCFKIFFMYSYYAGIPDAQNPTSKLYPQCRTPDSTTYVAVPTTPGFNGTPTGPQNALAAVYLNFATSGFIAFAIHAILLEVYFHLTPAESARLRKVSYERQVAAGFKFADKGSISATRLGDAPAGWNMPVVAAAAAEKRLSSSSSSSDAESPAPTERTLIQDTLHDSRMKEQAINGPNTV